jgi:DNA-binding MarR family transcriptional regulator
VTVADTVSAPRSTLLEVLAEFRYQLRLFTLFSEQAAQAVDLQPQQHQLLLQVAGAPADVSPSVAYAAERLGLRHNSAVELVDRSVKEGLLVRAEDPHDKRRVLLQLTARGHRLLKSLAESHARELHEMAPRLIRSLRALEQLEAKRQGREGDRR